MTNGQKELVKGTGVLDAAEKKYAELEKEAAIITAVSTAKTAKDADGAAWYDLKGRKLNGKPAKKGAYIRNSKKIVVR